MKIYQKLKELCQIHNTTRFSDLSPAQKCNRMKAVEKFLEHISTSDVAGVLDF